SSDDTYDLYGRLCAALERYDEAITLQFRARELDPLAHRMDGVTTLLRAGRYDQAVADAESAVEFEPGYDRARATLGWGYFLSGRQDEGLAELERAVSLSPANTLWLGQLGEAYAMAGNAAKAREILRELEERAHGAFVSPYHIAYVYTGLGDFDKAMDWLERAVAERTGPAYSIKGSFLLRALHGHPRFRALLRTMRLLAVVLSVLFATAGNSAHAQYAVANRIGLEIQPGTPRLASPDTTGHRPFPARSLAVRAAFATLAWIPAAYIGGGIGYAILPHTPNGDDPGLDQFIQGAVVGGTIGAAVGAAAPGLDTE